MAILNLDYYKNTGEYSDGDEIENTLISYFEKYGDKHLEKALKKDNRWPIFYHLTSLRQNLLNSFDFRNKSLALEVGGGFGALTGVLCDNFDKVVSVELSKRRAEGLYKRHSKRKNLEVIAANLNDIDFENKFDYVTLIGVLEYAISFTEGPDPFFSFLMNIKKHIKDDGSLLIAIENRLGLKYWCGAPEDHSGKPYDGILGYKDFHKANTFSKKELTDLLKRCGFNNIKFFYPYPDYKMPLAVFSDDNLPTVEKLAGIADPNPYNAVIPNEKDIIPYLVNEGVFPTFSNSFLVEASF